MGCYEEICLAQTNQTRNCILLCPHSSKSSTKSMQLRRTSLITHTDGGCGSGCGGGGGGDGSGSGGGGGYGGGGGCGGGGGGGGSRVVFIPKGHNLTASVV